jgi:hypothetical protein
MRAGRGNDASRSDEILIEDAIAGRDEFSIMLDI